MTESTTRTSNLLTQTRGYETHRNMVRSTEAKWGASPRATVMHTRDALGRITTLERGHGIYALYNGGGLRQSFTYTSKGELETAQTSQFGSLGIEMPDRTLGLSLVVK